MTNPLVDEFDRTYRNLHFARGAMLAAKDGSPEQRVLYDAADMAETKHQEAAAKLKQSVPRAWWK